MGIIYNGVGWIQLLRMKTDKIRCRKYKEINREQINFNRNKKINCSVCNLEISKSSLKRHNKRKHQ